MTTLNSSPDSSLESSLEPPLESSGSQEAPASQQPHQIPLDLSCVPAMGREDFMIAPCNQDALSWIDRWPDWPAPILLLQGPAACGKSHMAAVWASRNNALHVPAKWLSTHDAADIIAQSGSRDILIDYIDPWLGSQKAETQLFHLYNMLKESGKSALLTMRMTPKQVDFALPDLASRLCAAPVARIKAPDEMLLGAVLVKLFQDRQLKLEAPVLQYILPRAERSFAAIHHLVDKADMAALSQHRAISIPLMREVLANEHNL